MIRLERIIAVGTRLLLLLILDNWSGTVLAESPERSHSMVGHASCASMTCHGGMLHIDHGRADSAGSPDAWNQSWSRWRSRDPHAEAGNLLLNDQSRRIVAHLAPDTNWQWDKDRLPLVDSDAYRAQLLRRCVGCHVTRPVERESTAAPLALAELFAGVSCESCHGAASDWLEPHVFDTWNHKSADERIALGMLPMDDWLTRAEICGRCHIGSRTADGLQRDMNHDVIAAGHPALRFDPWLFMQNMPPHWSIDSTQSLSNTARFEAGRWVSLSLAADLSAERLEDHQRDSASAPWPELSQYDCFACHHDLRSDTYRGDSGQPRWNPWYGSHLLSQPKVHTDPELRLGNSAASDEERDKTARKLRGIARRARSQATEAVGSGPEFGPRRALARYLADGETIVDWHDAATWSLRVRATLADCDMISPSLRDEMRTRLDALYGRSRGLFFKKGHASPADFSPKAIQATSADMLRLLDQE